MICFGPEGGLSPSSEATTWPDDSRKVEAIIGDYRSRGPEEQKKRNSDVVGYLMEQRKKAEEELLQWRKENANLMYPSWEEELDDCSEDFLRQLGSNLSFKLEAVQNQIEELKGKQIAEVVLNNNEEDDHHNQMAEMMLLSQISHDTHYSSASNYLLDMNRTTLEIMEPMPISCLKPPLEPMPNILNYDFVNFGTTTAAAAPPPPQTTFFSPGYAMYETKEYLTFYKKDYDLDSTHFHSGSTTTNHRTFSLMQGGSSSCCSSSSSSSSSSHGQLMLTQPAAAAAGFLPHQPAVTGLHQSVSEFQSPGTQFSDLFWPFSTIGGNNI
ncbi:hypothetical protein H6P81_015641 [Aristolochia fimbriata]|uniref:Uncharacterized protein n=1 Tax=Aristolochia fimbriata TaxID=158543 RepID=A0AAV7E945_ARIFI|nr:hypothetical protein H6P81_015641 [Aristolochia fimbriata]